MPPQQEPFVDFKRNFNIAYSFFSMHQRALTVPLRNNYGIHALGVPCFLAFILMFLWATFSNDVYMFGWLGIWIVCQVAKRWESVRLYRQGVHIHSQYDGWPVGTIRLGRTEKAAKMFVEPIIYGVMGLILRSIYQDNGLPTSGLPAFFLLGVISLPFVEMVKQTVWERRTQSMNDARIEQQQVVGNYRDRYGDS